jgi:methyl-accepting chemotaxis protein
MYIDESELVLSTPLQNAKARKINLIKLTRLPSQLLNKLSLQSILVYPFILVIIISSSLIAFYSYETNKQSIIQSVEQQMTSSAEVINQKITMLKATVPKEEFNRNLGYALTLNRNNYNQLNLNPSQFMITKEGTVKAFSGFHSVLPRLSTAIIQEAMKKKAGIIHYNGMTLCFSQQVELDDSLYVLSLKDDEYLKPAIHIRNIMLAITLLTIIFASFIGFLTVRRVSGPITNLKELMEKVASGNLKARMPKTRSCREIETLSVCFNQMTEKLDSLISHLEKSTKMVTLSSEKLRLTSEESKQASDQIALVISEVASGTERQLHTAMESSNMVSYIKNGMTTAAKSILNAEAATQKATIKSTAGNELVNKTVAQMNLVQQTVSETAEIVHSLEEKSKHIQHIIILISEIAIQTNLLSLNAAIEAARAGEHGRGFAVVADEVRKLADQSGQAAAQIKGLIGEIGTETKRVVSSITQGSAVLNDGIELVHKTERAFEEIAFSIEKISTEAEKVSKVVKDVNNQTNRMVDGIEDIRIISRDFSTSMDHVAAASQEQNAYVDEVSNEAVNLNQLALELEDVLISLQA